MDEAGASQLVRDVAQVAGLLDARGWAEGSAGNISARIDADLVPERFAEGPPRPLPAPLPALRGACFLTSGTGTRMRDIAKEPGKGLCIARVAADGASYRVLAPGAALSLAPTSEFPSHLLIHDLLVSSQRPETAVVHTHPTELIALSHVLSAAGQADLDRALWSMHPEVKVFLPEGVGLVPYTLPGTFDLARATVKALAGRRVALWSLHGAVAVGCDPAGAFDLLDIANKAARIRLLCRTAGADPAGLPPGAIDDLAAAFGNRR